VANVGGGVLGKAAAHTVLLCSLVDCQICQESKVVVLILEGPVANVGGGILGKAAAHTVLSCPLVDCQIKFGSRSFGFLL
jgi:hypothetical protein